MNNNINNKKKEVPKGISLNDKDYLTNLLTLFSKLLRVKLWIKMKIQKKIFQRFL